MTNDGVAAPAAAPDACDRSDVKRLADGRFTVLSNAALRDERLSYRARGILAAALSHADGFDLTRRWIDTHGTEGRDAITSAIGELRRLGYVRDLFTGGRALSRRLLWSDQPLPEASDGPVRLETRCTENPSNGKPVALETRGTGNPSHNKKTNFQEDQESQEDQPEEDPPTPPASGGTATWVPLPVWSFGPGNPEPEAPAALPVDDPISAARSDQLEVPGAPKRKRSASATRYWDLAPEDEAVAADLAGLPPAVAAGCLNWWNEARRSKHGSKATWTRTAWLGSVARLRALAERSPADALRLVEAGVESGWQALKAEYLQPISRGGGRPQLQPEDYLNPDGTASLLNPHDARGRAAVLSHQARMARWVAEQQAGGVDPNANPFATLVEAPADQPPSSALARAVQAITITAAREAA